MKVSNMLQVDQNEFVWEINNEIQNILNFDILKSEKVESTRLFFEDYNKENVNKYWDDLKKKEKNYVIGKMEIINKIVSVFNLKINKNCYNLMRYIVNEKEENKKEDKIKLNDSVLYQDEIHIVKHICENTFGLEILDSNTGNWLYVDKNLVKKAPTLNNYTFESYKFYKEDDKLKNK